MARRFNCRRVKLHHSYTISELSALIGAHKHTIGRWIAAGLTTTDARQPLLIHGADFREFMKAREPIKQRCQPGEFYCLGCRAPRRPALDMADYHPRTVLRGSLSGICPDCGRMIYRAASLAKIELTGGDLNIAYPKAEPRQGQDHAFGPLPKLLDREGQSVGAYQVLTHRSRTDQENDLEAQAFTPTTSLVDALSAEPGSCAIPAAPGTVAP